MPGRANSTVNVNITGDAKSLQRAAATAEGAVGGMNKKLVAAGAVVAGAFVVDQLVDFGNTAVKEADRVADAAGQIEAQLGPDLSKALIDRADDFSKLGQSEGDMLELEKRIIDIGRASGATDDQLAPMSEKLAAAAGAMTLIDTEGRDANYWIEQIGKAAGGAAKPLQELGVNLDPVVVQQRALADSGKTAVDQLTAEDYWGARVALIMEQLAPKIEPVVKGTGDLEQKQAELNAKWETLTGEIGGPLTDLLSEVLDFVLRGIDGWQQLAEKIDENRREIADFLGPLARAVDLLGAMLGLLNSIATFDAFDFTSGGPVGRRVPRLPTGGGLSSGPSTVNVNVQGGSPEVIEQSVRNAVNTVTRRSGALR